jgi:DHA2 family multidrug resistance protein-like MFS transporter
MATAETTSFRAGKWWAVPALSLAVLAVGLDTTILSVALATLATDLHASTSELQWFVSAYSLVFAAAMVPSGMLGDRYGRKKVLVGALVLFGLGSLSCAYATGPGQFIAARILLGFGAAAVVPMALGSLPVVFSEKDRPRAVAAVTASTVLGMPLGPILGGWILNSYWWGWVFLINVPVVLIGIIAVIFLLPESRSPRTQRFDPVGIVTSGGGLALLTYGFVKVGSDGWTSTAALIGLVGGIVVLLAFVLFDRRIKDPLVDFRLFRSRGFTAGSILSVLVSFALFGIIYTVPLYLQEIGGNDVLGSGLRLLPLIGGLVVGTVISQVLVKRTGVKMIVALGFVALAVALGIGATSTVGSGTSFVELWLTIGGVGTGLALPTATDAALETLSEEMSGVGSALLQALRMVAGSFGAALLSGVINSQYRGRLDTAGLPDRVLGVVKQSVVAGVAVARELRSSSLLDLVRHSFVRGMDLGLATCCGMAVVAVVFTMFLMPSRPSKTAAPDGGPEAPATEEMSAKQEPR